MWVIRKGQQQGTSFYQVEGAPGESDGWRKPRGDHHGGKQPPAVRWPSWECTTDESPLTVGCMREGATETTVYAGSAAGKKADAKRPECMYQTGTDFKINLPVARTCQEDRTRSDREPEAPVIMSIRNRELNHTTPPK